MLRVVSVNCAASVKTYSNHKMKILKIDYILVSQGGERDATVYSSLSRKNKIVDVVIKRKR